MTWKLTDRRGKPIVAGTLEQMFAHLKFTAKDGEYQLVRGDTAIHTQRHQGVLYSIGIGRTHANTRVVVLAQDLDIRIINATTGELLRQLTLDPTRDYQPRGLTAGPKRTRSEP